jgi:hypothetical protein
MRRHPGLLGGAGLAVLACWAVAAPAGAASGVSAAPGRPAVSAPAAVFGSWGSAQQVRGTAALNVSGAQIDAISCPSAGNCSAAGTYRNATGTQVFTVDQTAGRWGTARELPDFGALNTGGSAQVSSLSCASAGNCGLGGSYGDSSLESTVAFVASEKGGVWGAAIEVPDIPDIFGLYNYSSVVSISCPAAGDCAAGGIYIPNAIGQALDFVVNETAGVWGAAQDIPGTENYGSGAYHDLYSVSCGSAGNCAAVGTDTSGGDGGMPPTAFFSNETAGGWGEAQYFPGPPSDPDVASSSATAVSCTGPGDCSAGGTYGVHVFGASETDGTWDTAVGVPLPAGIGTATVNVNSISCPSAGNCAMGGPPGFLADETRGAWTKAITVPGLLARPTADVVVTSVSCRSPGNCSAAGTYRSGAGRQVFVVGEAGGTWEMAQQVPGTASLNAGQAASVTALSCGAPATCSAGGYYTDRHGVRQAFLVSEKPGAVTHTALTRTALRLTYGHEQAERFSYKVTARTPVTSGAVTVNSSGTPVCASEIGRNGSGACSPAATGFPAGTHRAVAIYDGAPGLALSSSAPVSLTVAKATSRTSLALSAARITDGHEQAELLTVTVSPLYAGMPAGSVTVKTGRTVVCVARLSSGKGSCRLTARQFKPGRHHLIADYGGSADFDPSASAAKTLTVVN